LKDCERMGDEGLRALALLTALTDLDLCGCHRVSDEGILAPVPLTALTNLDLNGCT
jgi:hypothetical protein